MLSCCKFSVDQCRPHCAGAKCSGKCTLTCGFTGQVCPPVTCEVANPAHCTGGVSTDPCDDGYTQVSHSPLNTEHSPHLLHQVGTKCWKKTVSVSADTWLDAVEGCKTEGAVLASVTSAEEQTQVEIRVETGEESQCYCFSSRP